MIKTRGGIIAVLTFVLALTAGLIAIGLGSVSIPIPEILHTLFNPDADTINHTIILNIRLPRVLLALIIGANIAISGAILQAVMGNPLADPGLTGVTSGAAVFVLIIMLVMPEYTQFVPLAAFVGGILAAAIVYMLA